MANGTGNGRKLTAQLTQQRHPVHNLYLHQLMAKLALMALQLMPQKSHPARLQLHQLLIMMALELLPQRSLRWHLQLRSHQLLQHHQLRSLIHRLSQQFLFQ